MVFERFKEKMRQGTKISADGHHFKSTDNERVDKSMKEAKQFANKLEKYRKHILQYHAATASILSDTEKTLAGELPMLHDMDQATGKAMGIPQPNNASQSLDMTNFTANSSAHERRLMQEVIGPIDRWISHEKEFAAKLKTLDNHRLDFDTARRMHNRNDIDRVRQQQKHDTVSEETTSQLAQTQSDLDVKRNAWTEAEQQTHSELAQLLEEAGQLHTYMARALEIEAELLRSAVLSTGGAGAGSGMRAGAGSGYGGGNNDVQQQMGNASLNEQPVQHIGTGAAGSYQPTY